MIPSVSYHSGLALLLIGIIAHFCSGNVYNGFNWLIALDPTTSCSYNVTATVNPVSGDLDFYVKKDKAECNDFTVKLASFFTGETIASNYMNYPASADIFGSFPKGNLMNTAINGHACYLLSQSKVSDNVYLCSFTFNNLKFYVEVYANLGQANPPLTYNKTMVPEYTGNATNGYIMQPRANSTVAPISMASSCSFLFTGAGASPVTTNSSSPVYLQATETSLFFLRGLTVKYALVKNSTMTKVIPTTSSYSSWDFTELGACAKTNLYYSQLVSSNKDVCKDGCELSLIMTISSSSSLLFTLQTYGFSTIYAGYVSSSSSYSSNYPEPIDGTSLALAIALPTVGFVLCMICCVFGCMKWQAYSRAQAAALTAQNQIPPGGAGPIQYPGPIVMVTGPNGVQVPMQLPNVVMGLGGIYMCQACKIRPSIGRLSYCGHVLACAECRFKREVCPVCHGVQNPGANPMGNLNPGNQMNPMNPVNPDIEMAKPSEPTFETLPPPRYEGPNQVPSAPPANYQ